MRTHKQYQTPSELKAIIEESLWMYEHTPDPTAKQQYKLKLITATQDYYVVTGDYFHRQLEGNKMRGVHGN